MLIQCIHFLVAMLYITLSADSQLKYKNVVSTQYVYSCARGIRA